MSEGGIRARVEAACRTESCRVFATLLRLLGDFDLAEGALHDAFRVALEQWPHDGVPDNPRVWLISVGRFRAIDAVRRHARFARLSAAFKAAFSDAEDSTAVEDYGGDDLLRLIFTCHRIFSNLVSISDGAKRLPNENHAAGELGTAALNQQLRFKIIRRALG